MLGAAIVQANNLTAKTKPADVEAMYKSLEDGLGQCFPYGQDPLPSKIPASRIHLAPDSLKYRVFVEKRKEQVQLEAEALGRSTTPESIEKGQPRPKLAGAKHDPKFKVRATEPLHSTPSLF